MIAIITVIFVLITFGIIYREYSGMKRSEAKKQEENTVIFEQTRKQLFQSYRDIVWVYFNNIVVKDRDLKAAIISGDAYEIEDNAVPDFNRLKVEVPELESMTFYSPDGTVLRREHSDKKGDDAQKPIILRTMRENKSFSGVEEENGNHLFFITASLSHRGKVVGYVEAGMNFDSVINQFKLFTNIRDLSVAFEEKARRVSVVKVKDGTINEVYQIPIRNFSGEETGYVQLVRSVTVETKRARRNIWIQVLSVAIIAFCIDIFLIYILSKGIFNPLKKITVKLERFGTGDLNVEFKESGNEIGQIAKAMNRSVSNIRKLITDFVETSHGIIKDAKSQSEMIHEMKDSSIMQREHSDQIAASSEEMSRTVNEISQNTVHASKEAEQSASLAGKGMVDIKKMRSLVDSIVLRVEAASTEMQPLSENADKIANIINVIDEIADQTNLLALNAAIEAARAGEQGRGFAVVADEVRKLAEKTTGATKEIEQIVRSIQGGTNASIDKINQSVISVHDGATAMDGIYAKVEQIVKSSHDSSGMIEQIAVAAEEQSAAAGEITGNIQKVAHLSKESEEKTLEGLELINQLLQKVEGLKVTISKFSI
ncbi:MAG: hypothetical protein IEMM0002_0677 [bacterium]|nr:MAG: hypothetical protein IEMM0002_0677 [bacterium]